MLFLRLFVLYTGTFSTHITHIHTQHTHTHTHTDTKSISQQEMSRKYEIWTKFNL